MSRKYDSNIVIYDIDEEIAFRYYPEYETMKTSFEEKLDIYVNGKRVSLYSDAIDEDTSRYFSEAFQDGVNAFERANWIVISELSESSEYE